MPLAGGRGIQDTLNGEMSDVAARATSASQPDREEALYVSAFPTSVSSLNAVDAGSNGFGTTSIFTLVPMPVTQPITVARISARVAMSNTGSNLDYKFYSKLFTFESDAGIFKSVDESFNTIEFGGSSTGVANTFYHNVLPDTRKFQLDPTKKYFSGFFSLIQSTGGGFAFWNGGVDPVNSILSSTTLLGMPSTIQLADLSVGAILGAPNVIYSNQKAKDIFKWQ